MFPPHNSPHKGLRLKTLKPKMSDPSLVGGNLPIAKKRSAVPGTVTTAKAATISVRPVPRKQLQSRFLNKSSRNMTPMVKKSMAEEQRNSPTDRSKMYTSETGVDLLAPNLKLQRHKRISIIPKRGKSSLFSPELSPCQTPFDMFLDEGYERSPTPRSRRIETPQGDIYLPAKLTEDKLNVKACTEVRPSLSPPNNCTETKSNGGVAFKTVRWDLGTLPTVPPARLPHRSPSPVVEHQPTNKSESPFINPQGLDAGECLKSIQEWSKSDRERMESLLRALRELDNKMEEAIPEEKSKSSRPEDEITITRIRSLDPRVPDFQPLQSSKNMICLQKKPSARLVTPTKEIKITADENVRPEPQTAVASPRKNTGRKLTICDDHRASGREVDSFEQWYAEKQLAEFVKKYPKTGDKAPPKKKLPATRRSDIVATTGPTAGRNAAIIQQRLEFLLWKSKEKKAMEKLVSENWACVNGSA